MKIALQFLTLFSLLLLSILGCGQKYRSKIVEEIGSEEYTRIMNLSLDDFDQSSEGFRQYSGNYELTCLLIPEYISVNKLSAGQSRNLHWHLGQVHAFNNNYEDAISEMKQSYTGGSLTWASYVTGTIAFLEKDEAALKEALRVLGEQENQMNIEILEKFVKYFDKSYAEAYSTEY
jgi:hypothetical protein